MVAAPAALAPAYGTQNETLSKPWREDLNITMMCPDCRQNPPDLIEENADTICGNCGRVLDERLVSYESEWRTFASEEGKGDDPNRVGEAESDLLYGAQGTTIGGSGPNISKEARKLKKAQALQNEDKNNRALQSAYSQIETWGETVGLPKKVKDCAKGYYKRVYDANAFKGKNTPGVLAGCLFIACRVCLVPRTFNEMMNLTRVPKKDLGRMFKSLGKFLEQDSQVKMDAVADSGGIVNENAMKFQNAASARPQDLITRFCGMLGMQYRIQVIATRLAEQVSSIDELAGRSPLSTAGACIYFASNLIGKGRSTQEISAVINVSEATIKHAYKFLLAEKERLVQKDWLGEQPINIKEGGTPGFGSFENLPPS